MATKFYSPLRYPGGKNRLSKFISEICINNNIDNIYIEPFCGGASVGLYLLLERKVKRIVLNDLDKSIYAFWYCVLNETENLCNLIEKTEINIENWKKQKEIQENKENENLLNIGFSTLFLNRTNFSGVLKGGPIGGIKQKSKYKLNCRFNKKEIIKRIKKISKHKNKIILSNLDVLDLIEKLEKNKNSKNSIFYFDPPYFNKGKYLYLNFYKEKQHQILADKIKKIKNYHWIVSYDDIKEINILFNWAKNGLSFFLKHYVNKTKEGKEILYFSKRLVINNQP